MTRTKVGTAARASHRRPSSQTDPIGFRYNNVRVYGIPASTILWQAEDGDLRRFLRNKLICIACGNNNWKQPLIRFKHIYNNTIILQCTHCIMRHGESFRVLRKLYDMFIVLRETASIRPCKIYIKYIYLRRGFSCTIVCE